MELISRKAAIEHLYGRLIESANNNVGVWEDAGIVFEEIATERLKRWINEIPTINPMKWTPVTERLPDLWDERYLVSLAWGGVGVMEYKSTGFHNYGSFSPVPIETVTAWMTLPKPWKGEEKSEKKKHT